MDRPGVIFDLDDTLVVEEQAARDSLRRCAALVDGLDPDALVATVLATARGRWRDGPFHPVCVRLGFASWEGLWSSFDGGHPSTAGLAEWAPTFRREVWAESLASLGVDDPAVADLLADANERYQRDGHPLLDGAAGTLDDLAATHEFGLLTNGPSDIQRVKLDRSGLTDRFAVVVVSGEVGVGKPEPEAFELVLAALGTDRAATTMVGDSWERDVGGAVAAGMTAVWISHGRPVPADLPGVVVVGSVAEVPVAVRSSTAGRG
jgi:putative hydrolase of the HAD superfamily